MTTINITKYFLRTAASLTAALLGACSPQQDAADEAPGPDLIVINADVRTIDSTIENAEAFAISKGKFVAVGSSGEIQELARENTDVIDAGGVTVLPGCVAVSLEFVRDSLTFLRQLVNDLIARIEPVKDPQEGGK